MKSKEIRSMEYVNGFRDAVYQLEMETNDIISKLTDGGRETLVQAIDAFISTTYVLKLHADTIESDAIYDMSESSDCDDCDMQDECNDMDSMLSKFLNGFMKEEF